VSECYELKSKVSEIEGELLYIKKEIEYYKLPDFVPIHNLWRCKYIIIKPVIKMILDKLGLELKYIKLTGPNVVLVEKDTGE